MRKNKNLTVTFDQVDGVVNAVKYLSSENIKFISYSPIPIHGIENILKTKSSKVGWFTLAGAITGLLTGFGLAIYTSSSWNLILGGKPPVTLIPFVVIGFEFTILFGALATLLGLIYFGKFTKIKKFDGFKPDFTVDKFGLYVEANDNDIENLKNKLISFGAKEIIYD